MKLKEKYIKITGIYEVTQFVEQAIQVQGDVTIRRGKYAIDAKSFMGVMAIGIAEGVTIEYPENAIKFEDYIKQFETTKTE